MNKIAEGRAIRKLWSTNARRHLVLENDHRGMSVLYDFDDDTVGIYSETYTDDGETTSVGYMVLSVENLLDAAAFMGVMKKEKLDDC